jgi:4-hydroxybenzoate polyprenyltransferase
MLSTVKYLVVSLRPRQWVKNFFVVAPLFFSKRMMEPVVVAKAALGFCLFCLFSSSVYLINDIIDLESDKNHSKKSRRPLASGLLSQKVGAAASLLILAFAVAGSLVIGKWFLLAGVVYWGVNFCYTLFLKHLVIVDVFCIAAGFVLRVIAGGIAVGVISSHWILTTTIFLSLFLGFAKRRGEIALSAGSPEQLSRLVLRQYSVQLLDQFLVICATASIMSYALFTLSDYAFARFGTHNLFFTIPFVVFGVFRYFYLIHFSDYYENPTEALFTDKALIVDILLWIACVIYIVYV